MIDAAAGRPTPLLLIDPSLIAAQAARISASLPEAGVYYAVKANPHPEVSRIVHEAGLGFEVSSSPELALVLSLGATPDKIISSNPIKPPTFLREAYVRGVRHFVFDSSDELSKIAALAPESELCLRLTVDNSGSEWPLSLKYGVDPANAARLLAEARDLGLRVAGLTFHVGSQCVEVESWIRALAICRELFSVAAGLGIRLDLLNLGGGLPVQHLRPVPSAAEIGERVRAYLRANFAPDVRLAIEPGRAMIGEAAVLVTTVIGKAERGETRWLYLDAGVFNCLMETIGGFKYEIRTEWDTLNLGALSSTDRSPSQSGDGRGTRPVRAWTVAGPSCDSVDVLFQDLPLPDLAVGERLYVLNAGAYSLSYASAFNGFPPPEVLMIDSVRTEPAGNATRLDRAEENATVLTQR